ncbi:MAG: hypothetical protein F6J87_00425 [Spirulina sp. SIO3F2]|nr:hypothetical protein [Spirulina sp. SIO3F2]
MSTKEQLIEEINQAPDFLIEEVLSFFLFLRLRLSERSNGHQYRSAASNQQTPMFLLKAREISQALSANSTETLPTDLAKNLDHYLYGALKTEG